MISTANFLPPLSTEEFEALKADIERNGVLHPVIVDEDGNVLDGHHRLKIAPGAPRRVVNGLSENEKIALVYRSNLNRRNLSPDQKRELQRSLKKLAVNLNRDGKTQEEIAALIGVSQPTINGWLKSNHKPDNIPIINTDNRYIAPNNTYDGRRKLTGKQKDSIFDLAQNGQTQQQIAADFGVTQKTVSQVISKKQREAEVKKQAGSPLPIDSKIIIGDFRTVNIEADSIDLIFTDPPYADFALYGDLAAFGSKVLKPGGLLIAYSGQSHLPKIISLMSNHLEYYWLGGIKHNQGFTRIQKFKIRAAWKPLLIYGKPPLNPWWEWVDDFCDQGRQEKSDHEWQQALAEATYYIQKLTPPGGIVLDPCAGSGTTLLAARESGFSYLGIEIDSQTAGKIQERLNAAQ